MAENAQVMFFALRIPPEEQLPRLIEEYNALADRWTETHADLAAARDREKGLREAASELLESFQQMRDACVHLIASGNSPTTQMMNNADAAMRDYLAALAPETHDEGKPLGANSAVTGEKLKWK